MLTALVLAAAVAVASAAFAPPRQTADAEPLSTLVLMVDGVGYQVVDSLHRAGHFAAFRTPSRVISPFPSLTGVAFPTMWGEAPPPGYEDRYFDPAANRVRGGLFEHLFQPGEHAGFRRHVDVEASGPVATVGYLFPDALLAAEMGDLEEEIERHAATDSTVVAYVVSTDALAHRAGRPAVVAAVLGIERMIGRLRARHGSGLRVILFSDHGNNFTTSRRVALEDSLRAARFRLEESVHDSTDVVLPSFGLVGSSFLYSSPEAEPHLAGALVDVPGVDFVAFEDERRRVHVWDADSRAIVERRARDGWYRYSRVTGDPLRLGAAVDRLRTAGVMDADGFAPDSAWLHATIDGPYIDALRRVVRGMRDVVRHPASVVVSFLPGYYFGDPGADLLVDVAGTHGSLRTASSVAFFMSTHGDAPAVIRSDALHAYLPGVR